VTRTTPELVAGILKVNSGVDLSPFILAASSLVDAIDERTDAPSDERLQLIETWLSAHFYCMQFPRRSSEAAGSVSASYEGRFDLNLALSRYGQMAMVLDPTNYLKKINMPVKFKTKVGAVWLGTKCGR
jgi:hypothetical protein